MDKAKRKAIIAGNWKMNKTASEAAKLVDELIPAVKDASCEVVICTPFTDLVTAVEKTKGTDIHVGAENVHFEKSGAFTGEISADMLVDLGVEYVIVGHSERRQYFAETDQTVNKRALAALNAGLKVIICVGESLEHIMPIVMACMSMSKKYVGALLVIERGVPLKDIMDTGEEIDAKINQRLIENIFFKNSPLHDGAMVISNKRIMSAGCILPVSHNLDIPKELGLRHRAALGISQSSDAIAVIVSEETGRISVAIKGEFRLRLSAEELESILTQEMM